MNRRGFLSLAAAAAALSLLPAEPIVALPKARKIFLPPRGGWPRVIPGYFVDLGAGDATVLSLWRMNLDGSEDLLERVEGAAVSVGDRVALVTAIDGVSVEVNGVMKIARKDAPMLYRSSVINWPDDDRRIPDASLTASLKFTSR